MAGTRATLHAHKVIQECEILRLYEAKLVGADKNQTTQKPRFVREGTYVTCSISLSRPMAIDLFSRSERFGRLTLRDECRMIAYGKVIELPRCKDNKKVARLVIDCVYMSISS